VGRAAGLEAASLPVEQRPDPAPYDAVILGCAVYAGRWLEPARQYTAAHVAALRDRPVWPFSSGPIGNRLSQPTNPTTPGHSHR
jgi:menaquinone-dependent protoporphyrinogen oxidase